MIGANENEDVYDVLAMNESNVTSVEEQKEIEEYLNSLMEIDERINELLIKIDEWMDTKEILEEEIKTKFKRFFD